MLDQLRRHATSWMVKGTLTLIILTFIFFFGYSQFFSDVRNERDFVAVVGDKGIPRRRYNLAVQQGLDRMREGLKGEMPAEIEGFLKKNVLDQLVSRELAVRYAERLGARVSDEEIAAAIRSDKNLFPDGLFDPAVYEKNFLPYYRQRFGEEFEEAVGRDLLIQKVQLLLPALFAPWQQEIQSTLDPGDLFSPWLDPLGKETRVEIFDRP